MDIRVSVVMPVWNRQNFVSAAINSVKGQSFKDWELIIVDDCSTDATLQVIESYVNYQIHVLKTDINSGPAKARNLGIRATKGDFICFLDSDDTYELTFIEESQRKFQGLDNNVGMLWTGLRYIKGSSGSISEQIWKPNVTDPYELFLSDLRIGTNSGITVRKSVFEKIGLFDENLPAAEDTDLFLRISQNYSVGYVDKVLINIHQTGEDRLSKRFDKIAIAYNRIIPKHFSMINKDKKLRLKYFYKAMWLNYHLGDKPVARSYFKKILKHKSFSWQAWSVFVLFEVLGKSLASKIHIHFSLSRK